MIRSSLEEGSEDSADQLTLSTWLVIIWFFITDLWLLAVGTVTLADLIGNDASYISSTAWGVVIPLINLIFFLIWIFVFFTGRRDKRKNAIIAVTNTNYTDYIAWFRIGAISFFIFILFSTITSSRYCIEYFNNAPRAITDFGLYHSARVWTMAVLLFTGGLAFSCLLYTSVATWKYWALVWSCSNKSVFKNPFVPHDTIKFHLN